ncbi:MAG: DUF2069 domain-containing protein [Steroidobacteraceae bacterium]
MNGNEHRPLRVLRHGVVAVELALIALLFAWALAPGFSLSGLLWAAIGTAPLWIAAPRLRAGHQRTYKWMTMLVVPYVVFGLTELIANPRARPWAMACSLIAFALFVLLIAYLRAPAPASRTGS